MTNIDLLENQRDKLITKRYNKEKRFILIGRLAIALTIMFLTILVPKFLTAFNPNLMDFFKGVKPDPLSLILGG